MTEKNVSYIGIFTEHIDGMLAKEIEHQHITLAYHPTAEQFEILKPYFGQGVVITVKGYGFNLNNEGLLVEFSNDIPYFGANQKHITLSISKTAKAVDTGFLNFYPLEYPIFIKGKIGVFTKNKEVLYNV